MIALKDLPMEYRDSLALIMAEDEMPVTDVKRIARLFKDKEISDATKGKLLFKTGYQLLETWSTYEHNRKERAKSAMPKEEPYIAPPENSVAENGSQAPIPPAAEERSAVDLPRARARVTSETVQLAMPMLSGLAEETPESDQDEEPTSGSFVEDMLNLLLATLPPPGPLSPSDLPELEGIELQQFSRDVDTLIADLEKHLAEWRSVKDMLTVRK